MSKPANLIINTHLCTACQACELACHFHHSGHFGTFKSSICLHYDPEISSVTIEFEDTCDDCSGENEPLCAHFCVPGAIAIVE
jgi:Fe-S-cluster-containing dehydrogenase component